jgi:predicted Zn-dependent protease
VKYAAFLSLFLSTQLFAADSQTEKKQGDLAYKDGFHKKAWSFYFDSFKQAEEAEKNLLLIRLGNTAILADKYDETISLIDQFIKATKLDETASNSLILLKAGLQSNSTHFAEAYTNIEPLLQRINSLPLPQAQQTLSIALYSLMAQQKYQEASELIEKNLTLFANPENAQLENARTKILLEQYINAVAILDKFTDTTNEQVSFLKLWAYLKVGETSKAIALFDQKVKSMKTAPDPAFTTVMIKLSETQKGMDTGKAVEILDHAMVLEQNPEVKSYLLLKKGEFFTITEKHVEALETFYLFLKLYPQSPLLGKTMIEIARLHRLDGTPESLKTADTLLSQLIDSKTTDLDLLYKSFIERAETRFKQGLFTLAADDFNYAAETANKAKTAKSTQNYALYMAGLSLNLDGRSTDKRKSFLQGADFFQRVILNDSSFNDNAYLMQADCLRKAGDNRRAAEVLTAMMSASKNDHEALLIRGLTYLQDGQSSRGIQDLRKFIDLVPDDSRIAMAMVEAIRSAIYAKEYLQAAELISLFNIKLMTTQKSYLKEARPSVLHLNAIMQWKRNFKNDAEAMWKVFLEKYPEHPLGLEVRLWLALDLMGSTPPKTTEAIQLYYEALQKHPDSALNGFTRWSFSKALYEKNEFSKALNTLVIAKDFYRKQKVSPEQQKQLTATLFMIGEVHSRQGNYELAMKEFLNAQAYTKNAELKAALKGREADTQYALATQYADQENKVAEFNLIMSQAKERFTQIYKCHEATGMLSPITAQNAELSKAMEYYWELFFGFRDRKAKGANEDHYYFCRAGYDLGRLQLSFTEPDIRSAINTYRLLAESQFPGTSDAKLLADQLENLRDQK